MRLGAPKHVGTPGIALALVTLGVCGLFIPTPADATTSAYTNPSPCSASVQNGVCISNVSAADGTSTVTLGMTVGKATDPTTDPNWLDESLTLVSWSIAIDGATTPTYAAEADSSFDTPGTFSGVVESIGPASTGGTLTKLCGVSSGVVVSFDLATNQYGISFPSSCIGSPSSLAVQAQMAYTAVGGTLASAVAPGTSQAFTSCCTVTPDATTTGSSTTTSTTATASTTTSTTISSTTTTDPASASTTTVPSSSVGATTTTTTAPGAAVLTSPSSTGNTGTASTGSTGTGSPALASTGAGDNTLVVIITGVVLIGVGGVGRRRFVRRTRPAKRSQMQ